MPLQWRVFFAVAATLRDEAGHAPSDPVDQDHDHARCKRVSLRPQEETVMQIGINVPEPASPVRIIPERGAQTREGTIDDMRRCRDGVLSKLA
jgi:hypothetical protein